MRHSRFNDKLPTGAKPPAANAAKPIVVPSILRKCSREDAVVVIQSFSKSYCMTGWRLGWMVGRKDIVKRAAELTEFYVSCASGFGQRAGETALLWGEKLVAELLVRLRENRDFCLAAMRKMPGITVPSPDGAFYLLRIFWIKRKEMGIQKNILFINKPCTNSGTTQLSYYHFCSGNFNLACGLSFP